MNSAQATITAVRRVWVETRVERMARLDAASRQCRSCCGGWKEPHCAGSRYDLVETGKGQSCRADCIFALLTDQEIHRGGYRLR